MDATAQKDPLTAHFFETLERLEGRFQCQDAEAHAEHLDATEVRWWDPAECPACALREVLGVA